MARWIDSWNPEDTDFWQSSGKKIARRNLIWSIVAENLGFSVWLVWSVTVPQLARAGFHFSTAQLFTLVSLPGLVGALMRVPYTFAVPRFGGRNWTIVSALLLLIPAGALAILVGRPQTPFWLLALAAATAGLGGGNFASSMANISFFYPDREKGFALGLNAAGGNIGVSTVQLLVPIVVGAYGLRAAGAMWMAPILVAAIGAFLFMDNLTAARSDVKAQLSVLKQKHTWLISFLYIGTFGSFVGYSAAFPLLLKTQFPHVTAPLAFLGPLVGSLARPVGGRMSDRLGGARVTLWNFCVMGIATAALIGFVQLHSFAGFLLAFLALFVTTGIGNGSTFKMVPTLFPVRRECAAVLGLSSAIGALGGFFIPRSFGASIAATGGVAAALFAFLGCYIVCLGVTWWVYLRPQAEPALVPELEA
jgi:NNP family nitrate/nitrite transporter-like MFS transporter